MNKISVGMYIYIYIYMYYMNIFIFVYMYIYTGPNLVLLFVFGNQTLPPAVKIIQSFILMQNT